MIHAPTYNTATITFPEFFERNPDSLATEEVRVGISMQGGNTINFKWGEYSVSARMAPYNLPEFLWDNERVQMDLLEPVKALVVADLATIDDLLLELRELTRAGKVQDSLYYRRDANLLQDPEWFRVFDYMGSRDGEPFQRMTKLQGIPKVTVREIYRDLHPIAPFVKKPESAGGSVHYVEGNTLKEAVQRALTIYKAADQLKRIPLK